jgi:stearoyl-CoA desaturase (delta-9 desaturase)
MKRFDFPVLAILVVVHAAGLSCIFVRPTWTAFALFVVFTACAGFGITIGFHRFLAHRSFECSRTVERIWCTLGTLALQGGPMFWAGLHRRHHQFSDREGDPHSPRHTLLEGHMLWMARRGTKDGAVLASLASNDLRTLSRDGYVKWLDRGIGPLVPWALSLGICYAIGGYPGLVWGGFARTLYVWHTTWIVNSAGHRWGARPYDTRDSSRNSWWLPMALGDQWHNNHHADPRRALLKERWWQLDPSGFVIVFFEKLGLHKNVIRKKRSSLDRGAALG